MKLRVGGVRASGDGYPNAEETLRLLAAGGQVEIIECGARLPASLHLWRLARAPLGRKALGLVRLLALNLASVFRVVWAQRREAAPVYVPYPAVFFLWLLSWMPRRLRPYCIADAYISVWDSMFRDRAGTTHDGLLSRTVRAMEGRALRAAARVVVDTRANLDYLADVLALPKSRLVALPLAIHERPFVAARGTTPAGGPLTVCFVGTMIPLHGIDAMLDGLAPLMGDARFHFVFIGDGQSADALRRLIAGLNARNIEWIPEWQSSVSLAEQIGRADVCLGVFGGGGKAARVLPFKLYLYFAAGKPVISQPAMSMPGAAPFPPLVTSAPAALADTLLQLQADPAQREHLGREAAAYYDRWFANARVCEAWGEMIAAQQAST